MQPETELWRHESLIQVSQIQSGLHLISHHLGAFGKGRIIDSNQHALPAPFVIGLVIGVFYCLFWFARRHAETLYSLAVGIGSDYHF